MNDMEEVVEQIVGDMAAVIAALVKANGGTATVTREDVRGDIALLIRYDSSLEGLVFTVYD